MHNVIVGTAGHVDHGETCLIKALTGTDTDRLKEEQKRGITIELDLPVCPGRKGSTLESSMYRDMNGLSKHAGRNRRH